MLIYRLGSSRYPANDGLGTSLYGGRWNHKGTPVIYAAASRALCALEVLANANELADDYAVTPIELPDDIAIVTLSIHALPPGWNAAQTKTETADIGTAWAMRRESVVLLVPSAVIAQEGNYILNPRHSDFSRVRFLTSEPFHFSMTDCAAPGYRDERRYNESLALRRSFLMSRDGRRCRLRAFRMESCIR